MGNNKPFTSAILLGGGSGLRVGESVAKQWIHLSGETVFSRCVKSWSALSFIDEIIVVIREEDEARFLESILPLSPKIRYVFGGNNRAQSAKNGFMAIDKSSRFVAISDVARCLLSPEDILAVLEDAYRYGSASAVRRVTDTVKVLADGKIGRTIPRDTLLLAQTPQVFRTEDYQRALAATEDLSVITDDNMLLEQIGIFPHPTYLSSENPKLTTPEDISKFEAMLKRKENVPMGLRVGNGYDAHRFAEGRTLILGGVTISFELGLLGHSDADVLVHAIMDALLGAMGLGDIGKHFPDSDERYKDISSLELLRHVAKLMREKGSTLINLDATLVMQRPKVSPYINIMVENIARVLGVSVEQINIKATTEEGMGFTGRMEGVCAYATCLLTL